MIRPSCLAVSVDTALWGATTRITCRYTAIVRLVDPRVICVVCCSVSSIFSNVASNLLALVSLLLCADSTDMPCEMVFQYGGITSPIIDTSNVWYRRCLGLTN